MSESNCEMLEIDKLDVSYGDLQALWGVSFTVYEKEIVVILGSNGAGKTTIMKTLTGLIKPTAGSIVFNGDKINRLPAHKRVRLGISLVPEGRGLFTGMSVIENLELGAYNSEARSKRKETIRLVFEMFPFLRKKLKQIAGILSGGEQQMLAIGRGLMSRPKLLVLDEPSLGLAPLMTQTIFDVIDKLNRSGTSIILVEQNVHMSLAMANRGYIIENGRIVRHGDAKRLLHDEDISDAYLGTVSV